MIPAELARLEPQLLLYFVAMVRPGAAFLLAPLFGSGTVPLQLRLLVALAVAVPAVAATRMAAPPPDLTAILPLVAGEALIGLAIGFAVQVGLAAALVAGEIIGNAMGLGFAAMADPTGGHSSTTVGQLLNMLALALFCALDGHLQLVRILVESFTALPPGEGWLGADLFFRLAHFGALLFEAGVLIALPVAAALVLGQLVLATVTRAAPSLNLFAVTAPATLLGGLILLSQAVPIVAMTLEHTLAEALGMAATVAGQ